MNDAEELRRAGVLQTEGVGEVLVTMDDFDKSLFEQEFS